MGGISGLHPSPEGKGAAQRRVRGEEMPFIPPTAVLPLRINHLRAIRQ
jgi:hypothetical protein